MVTQEQIVKEAHIIAIKSLKNFFRNLGFNEEAFNHIYNIELFIEPIALPNVEAMYRHTESLKDDPIDNTIVVNSKELDKYIKLINKNEVNLQKVVLQFATSLVHEMIHANRNIILDYVIKEQNKKNKDKISNINYPPKEEWYAKSNLVSEFYHNTNKLDEEFESDRIYYQGDFEETITEALSDMIVKTRNENEFNLIEINNDIQKSNADMVIKMGSQILTNMGIDTVKWFMTSAYENSYYDEFEHTFQEKYEDLLYDISDIYSSIYCNQNASDFSIKDAQKIIEEKTSKKR